MGSYISHIPGVLTADGCVFHRAPIKTSSPQHGAGSDNNLQISENKKATFSSPHHYKTKACGDSNDSIWLWPSYVWFIIMYLFLFNTISTTHYDRYNRQRDRRITRPNNKTDWQIDRIIAILKSNDNRQYDKR